MRTLWKQVEGQLMCLAPAWNKIKLLGWHYGKYMKYYLLSA